jgi:hypothetical protein
MKTIRTLNFPVLGALLVLLAGCFDPVTVVPPKTGNPDTGAFTVTVRIGNDAAGRSIAGPGPDQIKTTGIRNFAQLIVLNEAGNIAAYAEDRRPNETATGAELTIESIPFNAKYYFLMLMGHWDREYAQETAGGDYVYAEDRPPTLLAAGLKEVTVTGNGTIEVTMWPLVVDTQFVTMNLDIPSSSRTVHPAVPGGAGLLAADWGVKWTPKRGGGVLEDGLTDLIRAQIAADTDAGNVLLVRDARGIVNGAVLPAPALTGNVLTLDIKDYTGGVEHIGTTGSVNFNLEYVPYNITDPAVWDGFTSVFNLDGSNVPVWILRNGVNDEAQNGSTNFAEAWDGTANGNGAVAFAVPENLTVPEPDTLEIKDGEFRGPGNAEEPYIKYVTGNYTGNAEVYYAVAAAGDAAPGYSAYTQSLGWRAIGTHDNEQITLPDENGPGGSEDGYYDVYVRLLKGGKVSEPIKINTAQIGVLPIWGDEVYLKLYVASYGDDNNSGGETSPFRTLDKALAVLAQQYAGDPAWPNKGAADEASGAIVVLDTVRFPLAVIDGSVGYPPIILDGNESHGSLEATFAGLSSTGAGLCAVAITNGARVTMDGRLTLSGNGQGSWPTKGVAVNAGKFTMSSGIITNFYAGAGPGGIGTGVAVNNGGSFIMQGGEIRNNPNHAGGGGVGVADGTFIMEGGLIADNIARQHGGGVSVAENGTFIMRGGEISGNETSNGEGSPPGMGGGVYVAGGFRMEGGLIAQNIASNGGGVAVYSGGSFDMTDGVIAGNHAYGNSSETGKGGGVFILQDHLVDHGSLAKTGGTIYGGHNPTPPSLQNMASTHMLAVAFGDGHAVYVSSLICKDLDAGPSDNLTYPIQAGDAWD